MISHISLVLVTLFLLAFATPGCTKNVHETTGNQPKPGSIETEIERESTTIAVPEIVTPHSVDDSLFKERLRAALVGGFAKQRIGERVASTGKLFLGTPYVGGTLEEDVATESLVINLRGLDCVTFYENALAFARILGMHESPTFLDYRNMLKLLRYRDGILRGYESRLHYTIDYFRDAEKKGVVKLVTREVGKAKTVRDTRTINFMSAHRALYKQLANDTTFERIVGSERAINQAGGFDYIPKNDVAAIESAIQSGDIIGVTTSLDGLDCSHTGIAVRTEDGKLHFMHASSAKKEVIISAGTLAEYLSTNGKQTGIIIARPLEALVPAMRN